MCLVLSVRLSGLTESGVRGTSSGNSVQALLCPSCSVLCASSHRPLPLWAGCLALGRGWEWWLHIFQALFTIFYLSFSSMTFGIYSHFQTKVTHFIWQGRDYLEQRFANLRVLGPRPRVSMGLGRDSRICISIVSRWCWCCWPGNDQCKFCNIWTGDV